MSTDRHALARITPNQRMMSLAGGVPGSRTVTPRQKAAIIVRYMLGEGAKIPLSQLPEHMQSALAEQMGHASVATTMSFYAAAADEAAAAIADAVID